MRQPNDVCTIVVSQPTQSSMIKSLHLYTSHCINPFSFSHFGDRRSVVISDSCTTFRLVLEIILYMLFTLVFTQICASSFEDLVACSRHQPLTIGLGDVLEVRTRVPSIIFLHANSAVIEEVTICTLRNMFFYADYLLKLRP